MGVLVFAPFLTFFVDNRLLKRLPLDLGYCIVEVCLVLLFLILSSGGLHQVVQSPTQKLLCLLGF